MDSILISVKKMLGITEEYTHFDANIIIHINSVFSILTQLGVGPPKGFSIKDASATWDDFVPENPQLELIKSYMYMKVKLLFDPPLTSSAVDSMQRLINELECRINITVDSKVGHDFDDEECKCFIVDWGE